MAIDENYIELINADIDGELNDADKAELETYLAENAEARELHAELAALCDSLDGVEAETPPPHLRHVIMSSVKPKPAQEPSPGFFESLFATPALKYAATFAAGVILTLTIIDSDEMSNSAFDDMTGMVGTVADPVHGDPAGSVSVNKAEVAGFVSLSSTDSLLILDFDLVANEPIQIEAEYTDQTIWFNGFAQLESSGTSVSAETGRVTLGMEGKRRYAVYLHNSRGRGTTVNLRFKSGDQVVHEASIDYEPGQ